MKTLYSLALMAVGFFTIKTTAEVRVLTVPGLNGGGNYIQDVHRLLGTSVKVTEVGIPPAKEADLGQTNCQLHLSKAYNATHDNLIMLGTSQGTATVMNFLPNDTERRVKAVILEAALVHGNRAIEHNAKRMIAAPIASVINSSLVRSVVPYAAKAIMLPKYNPSGNQPIKAIEQAPQDVLFIIAHATQDPELPYDDACALYYRLRERGNPAYLITVQGDAHVGTLRGKEAIVQRIVKHHGIVANNLEVGDLSLYQPDHRQFKHHYEALVKRGTSFKGMTQSLHKQ